MIHRPTVPEGGSERSNPSELRLLRGVPSVGRSLAHAFVPISLHGWAAATRRDERGARPATGRGQRPWSSPFYSGRWLPAVGPSQLTLSVLIPESHADSGRLSGRLALSGAAGALQIHRPHSVCPPMQRPAPASVLGGIMTYAHGHVKAARSNITLTPRMAWRGIVAGVKAWRGKGVGAT